MKLLGIDTSGKIASAAVCDENGILAETTIVTSLTHSQVILPLCKKLLEDAGTELSEVDGLAVADGPGSYTGLRIGISAVKAMAFALNKPCYGISTLEALAFNCAAFKGTICSVMKARQELYYAALFLSDENGIRRLSEDKIIPSEELAGIIKEAGVSVMLTGDGAVGFYEEHKPLNAILAPASCRMQKASSLCFAAFRKEPQGAESLNARYLQPTKAEKDRNAGK